MRPTDPGIRRALAPARAPIVGVLAGSILAAALTIAQAFAIAAFVVAAVHGGHLAVPAAVLGAVFAARALVGIGVDFGAAAAAARVSTSLRRRLLAASLRGGEQERSIGARTALLTRGVAAAEPYLTRYLPAFAISVIVPPLVVVVIATQDLLTAAIVGLTLPLLPVFGALVGLATRDTAAQQWRAMEALSGHFLDVMKGLPTLVVFRRASAQVEAIRAISERYRRRSLETLKIAFASSAVLDLVATLSVALVAVVVGVRLAGGGLDLRTGLVVLLLAPEAYAPIRRAGAEFHAAAEGAATFAAVERVERNSHREDHADVPSGADALVLNALSASYPGRTGPALTPLDAHIPSVGLTVIVGPSGCGKSTLLAALADLLPSEGQFSVRGADVGGRPWQSLISWLPQRPAFLSGSVADNIRLAAPSASEEDLWNALGSVGLIERIRSTPQGLQMTVGEDGSELSAGERARLALARALVAGRPWAFLDEPTAHLDPATRTDIINALHALAESSSVVVATHDAELIAAADLVLRLETPASPPLSTHPRSAAASSAPQVAVHTPVSHQHRSRIVLSNGLAAIASVCGVALTATAGWLIVRASEQPAVLTMLVAIVGVRAFGLGRPIFRYAARLLGHDTALSSLAVRRAQVYEAVVPLTPGALGRDRGGALTSIVDDVEATVDRDLRVREPLWSAMLVGLTAALLTVLVSPLLAAVVAGTCLAAGGAGFFASYVVCRRTEAELVQRRGELSSFATESIQMATDLVMWQAEATSVAGGTALAEELARVTQRAARAVAVSRGLILGICGAGVVGAGLVASATGVDGPLLALVAFIPLAMLDVLLPLADAGALSRRVQAADGRLHEVATRAPRVVDPIRPMPRTEAPTLTSSGVSAGWGERPAFTGLDFTLAPGTRLAVVGPSGSGKSTLAAALVRFIDPTTGSLSLSDRPLPELALDNVRATIGLVDDDPHIFATTLAQNLRLARPDASDDELLAALENAHLGDWFDGLDDGLDTWLGDAHAGVSGGERARLALARALLADPEVLVLDEPVAHLDDATAAATADALMNHGNGRSIVWITHRSVGLQDVHEIIDLGARHTA